MSIMGQMMFQDANSFIMENMIFFHDYAMMLIVVIISLIMYCLIFMLFNKFINRNLLDGQIIEIVWTVIPMILLIFLAVPSLNILYLTDENNNTVLTVKSIGHQWYWSYEYNDYISISFDSFMKSNNNSLFRLLDVDNRMVLPFNNQIRILVSSSDVIHSFAMPVLGVKVDAVPGRINQIAINLNRPGLFFGQCSEICGANHSFMPIVIESNSINNFLNWLLSF
uniref:Cytochrome c oxidase subunit 2 n=1 Tax=Eupelmus anpingensis TaxID=2989843 RepID=A0A9E8ADF2_9HYME|nr:cytochrome c oxidase subunit II [Eupelmus anpingensis]UYR45772.1 cytochrome c oxidase subunit 2 [Eupelmus anpingensis]